MREGDLVVTLVDCRPINGVVIREGTICQVLYLALDYDEVDGIIRVRPIDRDDSYFVATEDVRVCSPLELLGMQAE